MEVAATTPTHELVPQLQFPPGYRFVPTEEELVDAYLRAKIEGHKLPLAVVNDVSILEWQPGRLVEEYKGYGENRWFFFTVREQSSSNKEKEPSRKVRVKGVTATWKATGSVQLIRRARSKDGDGNKKVVVGTKRVLIYNSSDTAENGKWSMHEYYILKDHAAIGQYALYSIQRKQHSDTEGNDDMDPENKKKKTRKRKRTETETPSTELEGMQLPHPETTTLLAEPPLKPTRKAKVQRKKKPSMQVGVEGEQQQQQQGQSLMEPVTPPKKDELAPRQQEGRQQPAPPAADGAPAPIVLSAVPLQAVRVCPPSEPDGTLGASAPKPKEDTPDDMSQLLALLGYPAMFCNNQGQEQWPPSLTGSTAFLAAPDTNVVVGHAPLQPYQQQEDGYSLFGMQNQHLFLGENQSVYMKRGWQHADLLLPDNNTTQTMNSGGGGWEHAWYASVFISKSVSIHQCFMWYACVTAIVLLLFPQVH
ncbi:unnamed protein product [Miscanthus lutarioriparius]|uniref:NAC domain-containing protein n=1 Tax=Miscanthus lutarioriparius TaxID=422564 RepID=A0A811RU25_9POAL|nr:unnamed protein product [Miscanthus lutarioriparius]